MYGSGSQEGIYPKKNYLAKGKIRHFQLPAGTIYGARMVCTNDELLRIGRLIFEGGNHRLGSWAFALSELH